MPNPVLYVVTAIVLSLIIMGIAWKITKVFPNEWPFAIVATIAAIFITALLTNEAYQTRFYYATDWEAEVQADWQNVVKVNPEHQTLNMCRSAFSQAGGHVLGRRVNQGNTTVAVCQQFLPQLSCNELLQLVDTADTDLTGIVPTVRFNQCQTERLITAVREGKVDPKKFANLLMQ